MRTDVIPAAEPRGWLEALSDVAHDAYHLPGWALAEEALGSGVAMAVIARTRGATCVVPFIRRPLPDGRGWDAASPYGYGGPAWTRDAPPDVKRRLLSGAMSRLAQDGAVSFFGRTHPILDEMLSAACFGVPVVDQGPTVSIDLTASTEERWREIRSGHRSDIRRARDAGCSVELDTELRGIDAFACLYRETMIRIGAEESYLFGDRYFDTLRLTMGDSLLLGTVHQHGSLLGGALFSLAPGVGGVGYHLSAARALPGNLQPTKLLLAEVAEWAGRKGYGWMHLGGGLGAAEDSLFRFKSGFSPMRHRFRTLRVVLDKDRYVTMGGPSCVADDGYFPAYRDPSRTEAET